MARCSRCSTNTINLEAADTNCINTTVTGDGSLATPYVVSSVPIIDPSSSVTCGAAGLFLAAGGSSHTHNDPVGGPTSLVVGGTNEAGASVPTATAPWSIAMGDFAEASGDGAITIGGCENFAARARATFEGAIAIGGGQSGVGEEGARAINLGAIAIGSIEGIGESPLASAPSSIAIGSGSFSAEATGTRNISIGGASTSLSSSDGIAIGLFTQATGIGGVAIGISAIGGPRSISLQGNATGSDATCLSGIAATSGSITVGRGSRANTGSSAIAIGSHFGPTSAPLASAQGAIAIGANDISSVLGARATATGAIAIGTGTTALIGASATAASAIAIGRTASAAHANAVALGNSVATTATSQVNIGIKRAFVGCPTTAPAGADLINSQISFSTDEATNDLIITVKDSAGTVQTGTVALV